MKSEKLIHALSDIDDQFILSAAPGVRLKLAKAQARSLRLRWCAAAACLAVVVTIVGLAGPWRQGTAGEAEPAQPADLVSKPDTTGQEPEPAAGNPETEQIGNAENGENGLVWPVLEVPGSQTQQSESLCMRRLWAEMTFPQRYATLAWNGAYATRDTELPAAQIAQKLGTAEAFGTDENQELHKITADVFAVRGLSSAAVVAVRDAGSGAYYAYINPEYRPETLGQFIEDLNLRAYLKTGKVYYNYQKKDGSFATVEFTGLSTEKVWETLLSDSAAACIEENDLYGQFSVSIDYPLLGYHNMCLAITEQHQLWTNLLDTAKVFELGAQKSALFTDYVLRNCTGHELRYADTDTPVAE